MTPFDRYLEELLQPSMQGFLPLEQRARQSADSFGLGGISLSRAEASVLRWSMGIGDVYKAVEIGTLTGLSGLYLLDGLRPGGVLWTLEKNPLHAAKAKEVLFPWAESQNKKVQIVTGDAKDTLEEIKIHGPFDFIFIDGNKAAYGDYLEWSESNLKVGGILAADNVFLGGEVALDEGQRFSKKQIQVMRKFNDRLMNSSLWKSVILPTSEGFLISQKVKNNDE